MKKFSNDILVEIDDVQDQVEWIAEMIGKAAECEDRNEGIDKLETALEEAKFTLRVLKDLIDMAKKERENEK